MHRSRAGVRFDGDTVTAQQLYAPWVVARLDATPDGEFTAWVYRDLLRWAPMNCPAQTLMPRRVIDTVGSVCITPNGPQDYDYYLRIARKFPVTFHAANLARWRYRPDSISGPEDGRMLRSAALTMYVHEREAAACAPDDRPAVLATMASRGRLGLADAARSRLEYGTIPDPDHLATVYRFLPRDPVVVWTRMMFALPAPLDRLALGGTRAARRAVRTVTNSLRRRAPQDDRSPG